MEEKIVFESNDELLEVTPKSLRLRKKILDTKTRERETRRNKETSRRAKRRIEAKC